MMSSLLLNSKRPTVIGCREDLLLLIMTSKGPWQAELYLLLRMVSGISVLRGTVSLTDSIVREDLLETSLLVGKEGLASKEERFREEELVKGEGCLLNAGYEFPHPFRSGSS